MLREQSVRAPDAVLSDAPPSSTRSRVRAPWARGIVRPPAPVRLLGMAAVLGGLYALGALLPFWYLGTPESGAVFFPAAGLTVSTLTLTRRRTWPLWLATIAVAEIAVDLTHDQSV